MVGDDRTGGQAQGARPLDEPGAAGQDDVQQPADQPGRVHAGAVGRERAADRTVGADVLGHPVGVEQVRLVAPPGVGGDVVGHALQLRAVAGDA